MSKKLELKLPVKIYEDKGEWYLVDADVTFIKRDLKTFEFIKLAVNSHEYLVEELLGVTKDRDLLGKLSDNLASQLKAQGEVIEVAKTFIIEQEIVAVQEAKFRCDEWDSVGCDCYERFKKDNTFKRALARITKLTGGSDD